MKKDDGENVGVPRLVTRVKRWRLSTARIIIGLSPNTKRVVTLSVDVCLCVLATWFAFYLRLGEFFHFDYSFLRPAVLSIALALPIFSATGLYRAIFRYSGLPAVVAVGKAMVLYGLIYFMAVLAAGFDETPRTIGLIQPLVLFFAVSGSRLLARHWLGGVHRKLGQKSTLPSAVIYGAGLAGRQLAAAIGNGYEIQMIGFIDDDELLQRRTLNGLPVFSPHDLSDLVSSNGVTHVLLAMPSVSRKRRNEIIKHISRFGVMVRTLPSIVDLAEGRVTISDVRDLDVDDLLGRDSVIPNDTLLTESIADKTVLVTGAGGSIGSELCRQILQIQPAKILLVEINEFALYTIHSELEGLAHAMDEGLRCVVVPLLASVQDESRMRDILNIWRPDTLFHAAAYKHVPLVEHNIVEGLRNNVFGTLTLAKLAIESGISEFILISTDKAVRPTNVMGASKRLAELCLQALNALEKPRKSPESSANTQGAAGLLRSKTKLAMVRFGNVLDSSGSVIPRFRKQILEGGPITLTHPDVTRYFMTIPEAAQLVIQAASLARGGDVFVLNMGESVKISDLALKMIELSGLKVRDEKNPDGDIEIVLSGLRPGEKLYEELLLGNDPQPTQNPKIQRAQDAFLPWDQLEKYLETLQGALGQYDVETILLLLQQLVSGYEPSRDIVDWRYQERSRLSGEARTKNMEAIVLTNN